MNALEHIAFVLSAAVENDEIDAQDMRDVLRDMIAASLEFGEEINTEKMQRLSTELGKRYHHLINPEDL